MLWSVAIAELAAPISVNEAETTLVAITRLGDSTWLLIRSENESRARGEQYYEVEHRIVRLDLESGKAAESHRVSDG